MELTILLKDNLGHYGGERA